MGVKLAKDSIDLGIVVSDGATALAFYRDTLGFKHVGDMPMPGGGGTMHRLLCGTSMIKLVVPGKALETKAPAGGIQGAYGYRYWTISVTNLDELAKAVGEAGYRVLTQPRELRPGVRIAMIEDPDGNWVELLETR